MFHAPDSYAVMGPITTHAKHHLATANQLLHNSVFLYLLLKINAELEIKAVILGIQRLQQLHPASFNKKTFVQIAPETSLGHLLFLAHAVYWLLGISGTY